MANTTDIIITCFEECEVIEKIEKSTELKLPKITDSAKCGGDKVVCFESYAASYRCIGKGKIDLLIEAFKNANWDCPELAVMLIDDDNGQFSGIVTVV
jgi:hypothetical protein